MLNFSTSLIEKKGLSAEVVDSGCVVFATRDLKEGNTNVNDFWTMIEVCLKYNNLSIYMRNQNIVTRQKAYYS